MTNSKKDFEWFKKNSDELLKKYPNKELVIQNGKVVKAFDDDKQAYDFATKELWLGNFIIQNSNFELAKQYFHSRVVFS